MNILGLSAFYHESSACLLRRGRLVAAASEERFSRRKHDPKLPVEAVRFCLRAGDVDIDRVDAVAWYERPVDKLARQLWASRTGGGEATVAARGEPGLPWLDPRAPERAVRERLGFDGPLLSFPHHASHGASALFFSGFEEAAIFTVDGVGEWDTTTYGRGATGAPSPSAGTGPGSGPGLEIFARVEFPHSLGLLYSTLTSWLGFRVNGGEYKVMGLAPYGEPRHVDALRRLVTSGPGEAIHLDLAYFGFLDPDRGDADQGDADGPGARMDSPALWDLLGAPPRKPEAEITALHRDVARSLQVVLEEILLEKVAWLHGETGLDALCMAGGVALNCVANGRIRREGPFDQLFVQPAAGDAGGCLGAAALAHLELTGEAPRPGTGPGGRLEHVGWGPSWATAEGTAEVTRMVEATGLVGGEGTPSPLGEPLAEHDLVELVAEHLAADRIVGWFHGPMEFGPRALGGRSILASPLDPTMRDRVNRVIKKREAFRPFAPAVLLERATEHFDLDGPSPFMLETCRVTSPLELPAVTHVDGSARPQTVDRRHLPRFAALLDAFERRTGCPVLLDTSFNVRGEPIVCTPVDALLCFAVSSLDVLVLEDLVIERTHLPTHWAELAPLWRNHGPSPPDRPRGVLPDTLYTFV